MYLPLLLYNFVYFYIEEQSIYPDRWLTTRSNLVHRY